MQLRPYQQRTVDAIKDKASQGSRRILVVLPTGAGKTHTMAALVQGAIEKGNKVLALMHRRGLVDQMKDRFSECNIDSGIIMAGIDSALECDCQIASLWTYVRRLQLTEKGRNKFFVDAPCLLIDEAHHALNNTYQKVLNDYPNAFVIGFTATPTLGTGAGLGNYFDSMVNVVSMDELLNDGWLVPGEYYGPTEPDVSKLKIVQGDYEKKGLDGEMNRPELIGDVVNNWFEHANELQTMVFAVNRKHARALCNEFVRKGVSAEYLDARNDDEERSDVLRRFDNGDTQVICQVALYCMDDQTEVLTRSGWRGIDDIAEDDLVANWTFDGEVYFKTPEYIHKRELMPTEYFVSLQTGYSDIRVTNTHRVVYRTNRSGKWHKGDAGNFVGRVFQYPVSGIADPETGFLSTGLNVAKKSRSVIQASYVLRKNHGYSPQEAKQIATGVWERRSRIKTKLPHELSNRECFFIGFWLGDGSVNNLSSGGKEYLLYQSMRYPQIVALIDRLISSLGFDCVRRVKTDVQLNGKKHSDLVRWSLSRGTGGYSQERRGIFHLEPYLNKNGSDLFWGLSATQFRCLLRGFWHADGDHIKQKTMTIPSVFKPLVDLLQAICVCRGISANLTKLKKNGDFKQQWILRFRFNKKCRTVAGRFRLKSDESRDGRVWCVKSDSGNIITRRGGMVSITGNTEGTDIPAIQCLVIARPTRSLGLHRQILGRGARPFPSKARFLVLDHGGNVRRLGFYEDEVRWSLEGKPDSNVVQKPRKKERTLLTCDMCRHLFSGPQCPQCGHAIKNYGKKIEAIEAELVRLDRGKEPKVTMAEKERFYQMLEHYRRQKGYADGWLAHKFRAKFSVWPKGFKGLGPVEPDHKFYSWIKYQNIKWAKAQERDAVHA